MVAEHWLQLTLRTLVKIPGAGASFCLSTAVHRIIGLRIFLIGILENIFIVADSVVAAFWYIAVGCPVQIG